MKAPSLRTLELAAAWFAVAVAWATFTLGLVAPLLSGAAPGLPGPVGFAAETIAALWAQLGAVVAAVTAAVALRRLWWPAAALAPVVLVTVVPAVWPSGQPVASDRQPALRVATINLDGNNDVDPLMEASLRQMDADVMVLSEFTDSWARQLGSWFADDYPHRWLGAVPQRPGYVSDGLQIAVWSRIPPAGEPEIVLLGGYSPQIRVPLRWRGRAFALYGIHPRRPYPFEIYDGAWHDRQELLEWIRRERSPAIVAGDLNATPRNGFMVRLAELGLANASEVVCGRAPVTWSMFDAAPLRIAIDHVLVSDAFAAVGFWRGPVTMSDHAPVVAAVAWR